MRIIFDIKLINLVKKLNFDKKTLAAYILKIKMV